MNKMNKNKIDIEAKLFMFLLHLKEEKNKKYSARECETKVAYLFNNYDEFKSYFELNGFSNISEELLELCRMKTTKKGTIIALKRLCDHAIRRHIINQSLTMDSTIEEQFEVLAVPYNKPFIVSSEHAKEFINLKPDYELREQNNKFLERVNNVRIESSSQDKVLTKTKKTNKK